MIQKNDVYHKSFQCRKNHVASKESEADRSIAATKCLRFQRICVDISDS